MLSTLETILSRRAIRSFDSAEISDESRHALLEAASHAPSSFNIQPYRFYWIGSSELRQQASRLCHDQAPARTASALVVAVADIGSWHATAQAQLEWMRGAGFAPEKLSEYEKRSKVAKWFFAQGWFNVFGMVKWILLKIVNLWRPLGMVPVSRQGLFKWATKNTSLACENLMIATEALGLNSCPMEGFDARRLSKLLGLSPRFHEIVMVIAIGKKSSDYVSQPQWRRPIENTVSFL